MKNIAREYIRDKVIEYPDLPARTLARMIYSQLKECKPNLESVRSAIRYYRGKNGTKHKKELLTTYGKTF